MLFFFFISLTFLLKEEQRDVLHTTELTILLLVLQFLHCFVCHSYNQNCSDGFMCTDTVSLSLLQLSTETFC